MPKPKGLPSGMIKRGEKYYANFRYEGKHIRKVLSPDLQVAKVMLRDLRMKAYKKSTGDVGNDQRIAELADAWFRSIAQRIGAATVTRYRQNISAVLRLLPVEKVDRLNLDVLDGFREVRLAEGVKTSTVNKDVAAFTTMLNWAVVRNKISSNPIKGLKKLPEYKKESRALSIHEAKLILESSTEFWRRIWYAFFTTGMRKMELANLLFTDIDWEAREIIVRASTAKTRRGRRIPVDDVLYEILLQQLQEAPKRQPGSWADQKTTHQIKERFSRKHVFVTTANTPLEHNIYREFMTTCRRCGIETKTFDANGDLIESVVLHSTRHSFATELIRNGADPKSVQSLLGHRSIDQTMLTYVKVNATQKHEAIKKLSFSAAMLREKPIQRAFVDD